MSEKVNETSKEIAIKEDKEFVEIVPNPTKSVASYNHFTDFDNLEKFSAYANELLKAGFGNHTTKQGIMASWLWANDHNFPVMDCIAHLVNINGKVGADSHLIKAMIQRESILDETIHDFRNVYQYQLNATTIFSQTDIDENPEKFNICYSKTQHTKAAENYKKDNEVFGLPVLRSQPIDRECVIKFTRWVTLPTGKLVERIEYGKYLWSEAGTAGLITKDVWKKYPSTMLYWRAYTKGARRIADDILLGVYEKSELWDAAGIEYQADDLDYVEVK